MTRTPGVIYYLLNTFINYIICRYAICVHYMLGLDNITCHIVSIIGSSVYGFSEPLLVEV